MFRTQWYLCSNMASRRALQSIMASPGSVLSALQPQVCLNGLLCKLTFACCRGCGCGVCQSLLQLQGKKKGRLKSQKECACPGDAGDAGDAGDVAEGKLPHFILLQPRNTRIMHRFPCKKNQQKRWVCDARVRAHVRACARARVLVRMCERESWFSLFFLPLVGCCWLLLVVGGCCLAVVGLLSAVAV